MASYPKFEEFAENYDWKKPEDPAKYFKNAEEEAPEDKDKLNASAVKGREENTPSKPAMHAESDDKGMENISEMRAIAGLVAADADGHEEVARKNASAEAAYGTAGSHYPNIPSLPPIASETNEQNYVIIDRRTGRPARIDESIVRAINGFVCVVHEGKRFQAAVSAAGLTAGKTYEVLKAVGNQYSLAELGSGKSVVVTAGDLFGVAAPYPSK